MIATYAELLTELKKEFPKVKIVTKTSFFWRFLDALFRIVSLGKMRTFLTGYVTTIGWVIAVPEDWDLRTDERKYEVIAHERVHLRQIKRWGLGNFWLGIIPFSFAYLFLFLPFGLAYFRYRFEREAYTESLRIVYEQYGASSALHKIDFIVDQLTGMWYGYCWPFKKTVKAYMMKQYAQILLISK